MRFHYRNRIGRFLFRQGMEQLMAVPLQMHVPQHHVVRTAAKTLNTRGCFWAIQ